MTCVRESRLDGNNGAKQYLKNFRTYDEALFCDLDVAYLPDSLFKKAYA